MSILKEKAIDFATKFHTGQKRKYTFEPYINHCLHVAELVESVGGTLEMVCAAILHDTVEDTTATLADIEENFGKEIMELVHQLTNEFSSEAYPNTNRHERKILECERIAKISDQAKTIKLADIIDNTGSIVDRDPSFAKVYLKEKKEMLKGLAGGHPTLYHKAMDIYEDSIRKLQIS